MWSSSTLPAYHAAKLLSIMAAGRGIREFQGEAVIKCVLWCTDSITVGGLLRSPVWAPSPPICVGTVCILGLASQRGEEALQRVISRYRDQTGYEPKVFLGSSAGAVQFGHLKLKRTAAL